MKGAVLSFTIIILLLAANASADYYNLEINQQGSKALLNESFFLNNNYTSVIKTENIDSSGNNYYFIYKVIPQVDKNITIKVFLSEGFTIDDNDIYPKNFNLQTDGHRIIIIWHFDNLKDSNDIPIFLKFNSISSLTLITKIIIVIVALLLIFSAVILFLKYGKSIEAKKNNNKKLSKKPTLKDFTSYLSDGEKTVVEILRRKNSEMWQRDIQREGNFSKARLSRIIRNLEAKKIISKNPIGNTNKIKLKK